MNLKDYITQKAHDLVEKIVNDVLKARWIVSVPQKSEKGPGELGLRIAGVNLWYYKWQTPMVSIGNDPLYRFAGKREFGDVVFSIHDNRASS